MDRIPRFPSLFFRQKLNAVGIPMLIGVLLFLYLPLTGAFLLVLLFSLALLIFSLFLSGEDRITFRLLSLGFAFALIFWGGVGLKRARLETLCDTPHTATGFVIETHAESYTLALSSLDDHLFLERVLLPGDANVSCGEKRRLVLRFTDVYPEGDRAEGISLCAVAEEKGEVVGKSLLFTAIGRIRARLLSTFSQWEEGPFLSAILLGERSGFSGTDTALFRRTGTSHLLAISGLHITLAVSYFFLVLHRFGVPRPVCRYLLYPLVLLLFLLSGASLSAFRASVMTLFATTGFLLRRRSDSVISLVFSACVLVLLDPFAPESASFLLTYLCTFGTVTCAVPLVQYITPEKRKIKSVRVLSQLTTLFVSPFVMTLIVFCFSLPVQLLIFRELQPLSPLYAPILVTLFQPCLGFGLLLALCALVPFTPSFVISALMLVPKGYLALLRMLAASAAPTIELGSLAVPFALAVALVLLIFFCRKSPVTHALFLYTAILLALGIVALSRLFLPL